MENSSSPLNANNKSLNPFDESEEDDVYEESDEEPVTVIHSTPKSAPKPPSDTTNPFEDEDAEEQPLSNHDDSRKAPSPLPRTTLTASASTPPVPTPRQTKISPSGSVQSINSSVNNLSYDSPQNTTFDLRSHLNVSIMSTKSLNPFETSEEEEETDASQAFPMKRKNNIGGSQYSLRGDSTTSNFFRDQYRGSLPCRRKKRRAPLPPGMVGNIVVDQYCRGRMHVILNGEPLEEVDCFKYPGSHVSADGGCEKEVVRRMKKEYRAWGALKSVLRSKALWIKAKKCLYEGVIVPLYRAVAWV